MRQQLVKVAPIRLSPGRHVCPMCRVEYDASRRDQTFCSQQCRSRYYYTEAARLEGREVVYRNELEGPRPKDLVRCLHCGNPFVQRRASQKFCSSQHRDAWYQKHRGFSVKDEMTAVLTKGMTAEEIQEYKERQALLAVEINRTPAERMTLEEYQAKARLTPDSKGEVEITPDLDVDI